MHHEQVYEAIETFIFEQLCLEEIPSPQLLNVVWNGDLQFVSSQSHSFSSYLHFLLAFTPAFPTCISTAFLQGTSLALWPCRVD
jgi:hypothetical protein